MRLKILFFSSLSAVVLVGVGCGIAPSKTYETSGAVPVAPPLNGAQAAVTYPALEDIGAEPEPNQPAAALPTDTNSPTSTTIQNQPAMQFDATKHYTAVLKTSLGNIEVALNFGATPKTVENFVTLARKKFYDKTIFHRVLEGFMIQGGDPNGDGTGGPGYQFDDEPFSGEYARGTLAMANAGPNTNGSQFFIMHADYPLPKNYTIFGHVIHGMEVVDKIATSQVTTGPGGEPSRPVTPTVVESILITEQ